MPQRKIPSYYQTKKKLNVMIKNDLLKIYNTIKLFPLDFYKKIKRNYSTVFAFILFYLILFCMDPWIRNIVANSHNTSIEFFVRIGHYFGKPQLIIFTFILLYLIGIILKREKFRITGLMFFESFILSGIIVTVLKSIIGRWRPYTGYGNFSFIPFTLGPNDHLSLPSGDVATAFAFSVIAASIFENKSWKIFWYFLATLTAFGRIYNDQHWLTDVVLAATISLIVGDQVIQKNRQNESNKNENEKKHKD